MQVPKASCLFSQTVTAEPCILVVAGIVETTDAITNGISDLFFLDELFHGCAVKKEIIVRIGGVDTSVSFTNVLPLIFTVFTSWPVFFIRVIICTGSKKTA